MELLYRILRSLILQVCMGQDKKSHLDRRTNEQDILPTFCSLNIPFIAHRARAPLVSPRGLLPLLHRQDSRPGTLGLLWRCTAAEMRELRTILAGSPLP